MPLVTMVSLAYRSQGTERGDEGWMLNPVCKLIYGISATKQKYQTLPLVPWKR